MRVFAEQSRIREYEDFAIVAYLESASGVQFTTSNVSSYDVYVYEVGGGATPTTPVYTNTGLNPVSGFFDTRQVDGYATMLGDGGGYNFIYVVEDSDFHMSGGKTYRVEVLIHTNGFGKTVLACDATVLAVYS